MSGYPARFSHSFSESVGILRRRGVTGRHSGDDGGDGRTGVAEPVRDHAGASPAAGHPLRLRDDRRGDRELHLPTGPARALPTRPGGTDPGRGARGVAGRRAEHRRRADTQSTRGAQRRLPAAQRGRGRRTRGVAVGGGGRRGGVLPRHHRPGRGAEPGHHPDPDHGHRLRPGGRRGQVRRDRRRRRLAGRALPQHVGLPTGRWGARLRPVSRWPGGDRRGGAAALRLRHHRHRGRAVRPAAGPPPTRSGTGSTCGTSGATTATAAAGTTSSPTRPTRPDRTTVDPPSRR